MRNDTAASDLFPDDPNFAALNRRAEADGYRTLGEARHRQGDLQDAAVYYLLSLSVCPTAEAHTALGAVLAGQGQWEDAIGHCQQAIALDPGLGNPLNDLGVYLERLRRYDEALFYLEKAIVAPRYDCRHYPPYHQGRIYERQGRFFEARDAYAASLHEEPDWDPARFGLLRVMGILN